MTRRRSALGGIGAPGAWGGIAMWTAALLTSPAHAQEACVAPAAARALTSCEDTPRAAIGRSGGPPASLPVPAPRARRDAATPEPGFTLDETPAGARAAALRGRQRRLLDRERAVLERMVGRTAARDPRRADVLERLALTLGEIVRQEEARARSLDAPIFEAREAGRTPRRRALLQRQRAAEAAAAEAREAAVTALATLVADHPRRRDRDETLFTLAHQLERMGRAAQARQVYHRLLREAPQSRFVPHAYLAFAEHHFTAGDLAEAASFYERVLAIPAADNPLYGYARYKLAWVRFSQDDFRGALDALVGVLEHARRFPDRPDAPSLARQARRELVLPYARVGRPDRALAFFRRVGDAEAEALEMLEALGALYHDTGQWPESVAVHHRLMAERPDADALCRWQLRVLDATVASAPKPAQVREAERAVEVRRALAEGTHPPEAVRACAEDVATQVILLATAWHREAIGADDQPGTRDAATMDAAIALYRLLDRLPPVDDLALARLDRRDRPSAAALAYYRAELLFERQRWADAAAAYEEALATDDPALAADAAYGAVLAYDRHLGTREPRPTDDDRALTRRPFDEAEARMARTFRRFACAAPDHPELPIVLYRWARLHYEAHQLAEASVLFERVAMVHPTSEVGEYAANLYLDALNMLGERRGRAVCFDRLHASLEGLRERFCRDADAGPLCGVIAAAECHHEGRRAEALGRAGRHREAAEVLVTLVRDRSCAQAPQLLYDAAIHFEAARLLGRAIRVRAALVDAFGDHPLARRAIHQIGGNYHALAIYDRAAAHYERYAELDERCAGEGCPAAADGLRHAVLFRLGLGDPERALADARLFARRFGRSHPAETAEVVFAIGAVYDGPDDGARLVDHYRRFLRRHAGAATPTQLARAHVLVARGWLRQGQRARAEPHLAAAVQIHARGGEDAIAARAGTEEERRMAVVRLRDAASEALYELAEGRRAAFEAERFPTLRGSASATRVQRWAETELRPWMERKRALLRAAEEAYGAVAPLAIPRWRIAAASRIGDMYLGLVEEVRRSPVPDVIARDPDAHDAYLAQLDDAVAPFEQTAVARYTHCLRTATAVRWFDDRSRRCEEALHRLDAPRYPIASELRGRPAYVPDLPALPGPPREARQDG